VTFILIKVKFFFGFLRNQSIDAYISDYLFLNHLKYKQIDCDSIKLSTREFSTNGYSFVFSRDFMSQKEKVKKSKNI